VLPVLGNGVMRMRKSALTVIALSLLAMSLSTRAMAQPACGAGVDAALVQWRAISHGSFLRPSQRILLSDGRIVAGSLVNYYHVLIWRAANACASGKVKQASDYVNEANNFAQSELVGK
jgi:hypothetical protein